MVKIAILALGLAACAADIQGGAYYCGPAESCPPDTQCDPASDLCVAPPDVQAFGCLEGPALAAAGCAPGSLATTGCITTADFVDRLGLRTSACMMKLSATMSFPDALMPLAATIKDPSGNVVATSAPCGDVHGGLVDACVDFVGAPSVEYTIEVAGAPGGTTCDGACAFNRYSLAVNTTLP